MRSARLDRVNPTPDVVDVGKHAADPYLLERPDGGTGSDDLDLKFVDANPHRQDEPSQHHNQRTQSPNGVTHPASLPPDLAEVLVRQQYNEDEINSEREAGYRKGWNDHARHMLRMLAARESQ